MFPRLDSLTSFQNLDLTQMQNNAMDLNQSRDLVSLNGRASPSVLLDEDDDDRPPSEVSVGHSRLIDAVYSEMQRRAVLREHSDSLLTRATDQCCGISTDDDRPASLRHRAPSETGSDGFLELSSFAAEIQNSARELLDPSSELAKNLACDDSPLEVETSLNLFQQDDSSTCLNVNSHQQSGRNPITEAMCLSPCVVQTVPTVAIPPEESQANRNIQTEEDSRVGLPGNKPLRTGKRMDRLVATRNQCSKRLKDISNVKTELGRKRVKDGSCNLRPSKSRARVRRRDRSIVSNDDRNAPHSLCGSCGETFLDAETFLSHLQRCHMGAMSCLRCRCEFPNRSMFDGHECMERGKSVYTCTVCRLDFDLLSHLQTHLLNEHGQSKDRTVHRRTTGPWRSKRKGEGQLGALAMTHVRKTKFRCNICCEGFARRQHYEQHLAGHRKYDCTLCGTTFPNKKQMLLHMRQVHAIHTRQEKRHECGQCHARFLRPSLLEAHQRLHEDDLLLPLRCSYCGKKFHSDSALDAHLETGCGPESAEGGALIDSTKHFLCSECGATFYRKQGLLRHNIQMHSEDRPFECPFCDFRCKCKTNLNRHVELHKDERRFLCELCSASFHALATLKDHHAYVHSSERSFVCSNCHKGFKSRSALRRHLRSHSDARPYACECGQAYKRMSHLHRHKAALHGVVSKSKRVQRLGGEDGLTDYCLSEDDLLLLQDSTRTSAAEQIPIRLPIEEEMLTGMRLPDVAIVDRCLPLLPQLTSSDLPTPGVPPLVDVHDLDFGEDDEVMTGVSMSDLSSQPLPSMSQMYLTSNSCSRGLAAHADDYSVMAAAAHQTLNNSLPVDFFF